LKPSLRGSGRYGLGLWASYMVCHCLCIYACQNSFQNFRLQVGEALLEWKGRNWMSASASGWSHLQFLHAHQSSRFQNSHLPICSHLPPACRALTHSTMIDDFASDPYSTPPPPLLLTITSLALPPSIFRPRLVLPVRSDIVPACTGLALAAQQRAGSGSWSIL